VERIQILFSRECSLLYGDPNTNGISSPWLDLLPNQEGKDANDKEFESTSVK